MRLLVPLAMAAGLLVSGCGTERPTATPEAAPSLSSVPSPTATPTTAPDLEDPLANFPLARGYDTENGDDHSPVRVTHHPATIVFAVCDSLVWAPREATREILGVEWRGEAEWLRGRTLALYPSEEEASAALAGAREAVASCPDDPGDPGYGTSHTLLDVTLGDDSVVWADTFWFTSGGEKLHDTGLTVHHLVRVGRAVLLAYEYGEGNGSEESRANGIQRATELERPVVERMADL